MPEPVGPRGGAASRPRLFLDVDGVLNLYGEPEQLAGLAEHWVFPEDDEPVRLHPAHPALVRRLGAVFDLVWATGWNEEANTILAPLMDLPTFTWAPMPAIPFAPRDKVAVVDAYAGDRPAAWIDDVHTPEGRAWAAARRQPTLLLPTRPWTGLTQAVVERALAWARTLQA